MPLYMFECATCGPLEMWLSVNDVNQSAKCPKCNAMIRRVYGAPSLIFTPKAIRKHLEYGAEPRRVKTEPRTLGHRHTHHTHRHTPPRPWQIGH